MPSVPAIDVNRNGSGSSTQGVRPVEVFVSFADADRAHLDALVKHCALLEEGGVLRLWHRGLLRAGELLAVAQQKLRAADVIVLLVSADHHHERLDEARAAVARHGRGAHVVPVLVRPVITAGAPYAHLTMLPAGVAVASVKGSRDEVWAEIVAAICDVAERVGRSFGAHTMPAPPSSAAVTPAAAPSSPAPASKPPTRSAASSMSPAISFPPPLLRAAEQGKLAILFGSGLSFGVPGKFPSWGQLPERLLDEAEKLGIWTPAQIDHKRQFFKAGHVSLEVMLAELDTLKTAFGGVRKYRAAIGSIFRPAGAAPGDVHHAIAQLGVKVILTTNYDLLFEHVSGPPARMAYTWREADQALADIDAGHPVLFKIHGSAEHDDSIVMTRAEYTEAASHEPYQRAMSDLLRHYTFLIVGYGMNDPLDLDLVFELNVSAFGSASKTHYALMRDDVRATDRDRWQRDMNVQVVTYANHADLPAILRSLPHPP